MKPILILLFFCISSLCQAQPELMPKFNTAVDYLNGQNYPKAIEGFSEILATASDSKLKAICYSNRSMAYDALGDYTNSIKDLDNALAIDSTDIGLYLYRADSKFKVKDLDGAARDSRRIIRLDSTGPEAKTAYEFLWKISYMLQKYDDAITYASAQIRLAPDDSKLYFNRGVSKEMKMDFEAAIADYDLAITYNPTYGDAFFNRGNARINVLQLKNPKAKLTKEQKSDACSDLQRARDLGDQQADTYLERHCK